MPDPDRIQPPRGHEWTPLKYLLGALRRGYCPHCGERLGIQFQKHLWIQCSVSSSLHDRDDSAASAEVGVEVSTPQV